MVPTTFTFVTDGIESSLEQARKAAGGKDVALGGGARLFDHCGGLDVRLEPVRTIEGPGVTHLKYRIVK
ncbi:MAG: hypothetical protein ACREOF_02950 [Gemmatimonadales bacterium]